MQRYSAEKKTEDKNEKKKGFLGFGRKNRKDGEALKTADARGNADEGKADGNAPEAGGEEKKE